MTIRFITAATAVVATIGSTACASKNFVRTNVGEVRDSVETLSTSVEQTQERVRQNESRISEVSKETQAAQQTAQQATKSAQQASQSAQAAAELAKQVQTKTDAIEKAGQQLVYQVVMNEQEGGFRFGSTELPGEVKKQLDSLIAKLKQEPKSLLITIEGHTDNVGSTIVNERIGLERAMAVERYLYEQHQIPPQKMEAISYGEENPVAPNTTRDGRAKNRRVEIKVMG